MLRASRTRKLSVVMEGKQREFSYSGGPTHVLFHPFHALVSFACVDPTCVSQIQITER